MRVIGEPGVVPAAGAWVDGSTAIFRVSDPGHQLAGVHNYTAWRDAFHPHLTRLAGQVCR